MSVTTQKTIWCDRCNSWFQASTRRDSDIKRTARARGWKTKRDGDLCPACGEAREERESEEEVKP